MLVEKIKKHPRNLRKLKYLTFAPDMHLQLCKEIEKNLRDQICLLEGEEEHFLFFCKWKISISSFGFVTDTKRFSY